MHGIKNEAPIFVSKKPWFVSKVEIFNIDTKEGNKDQAKTEYGV